MKFKPVKVAIIGCGRICNAYLNTLTKEFSIIDVVGYSDLMEYKSKEKSEKYGIRQMTNEEILSDPEIEIVLNLTNAASRGLGAADMAWVLRTGREPRLSTEMGLAAFEIIHAVMACTVDG